MFWSGNRIQTFSFAFSLMLWPAGSMRLESPSKITSLQAQAGAYVFFFFAYPIPCPSTPHFPSLTFSLHSALMCHHCDHAEEGASRLPLEKPGSSLPELLNGLEEEWQQLVSCLCPAGCSKGLPSILGGDEIQSIGWQWLVCSCHSAGCTPLFFSLG